jgi:hypothetical protein
MKKEQEEEKAFLSYKTCFSSLKPQLLPKFIIFLFLVHFKRPKMLREHQLKLYKSFWKIKDNGATFQECLAIQLPTLKCPKLFFLDFLTFWFLRIIIFSFFIYFWQFLMVWMCQDRGFNFSLDTMNKVSLPWNLALLWATKCTYKLKNKRKTCALPSANFKIKRSLYYIFLLFSVHKG